MRSKEVNKVFGKKAEAVREKLAFSVFLKCFYFFTQTGQEKQKPESAFASLNQTDPLITYNL